MVWLIANDLNFDDAKKLGLSERAPHLELCGVFPLPNTVAKLQKQPRPRIIKSHLPVGLLPTEIWSVKPKLVYVARNVKDVAISYYHHYVNFHQYKGTKNDFLDTFLNDLALFCPYSDHVINYWKLRNEPNILFITYEAMIKDLKSVVKQVAQFLNKSYTNEQFDKLVKHLSFNEMKKNKMVNYEQAMDFIEMMGYNDKSNPNFKFIRRGQVNSSKDEMPVEYQAKYDHWIAERFKGSDYML